MGLAPHITKLQRSAIELAFFVSDFENISDITCCRLACEIFNPREKNMQSIKTYSIPLGGVSPSDLDAICALFEEHSSYFDGYLLAKYGGDGQYQVVDESFKVIGATESFIEFNAVVNYFSGCKDQDHDIDVNGSAYYEITNGHLNVSLDETVWNQE